VSDLVERPCDPAPKAPRQKKNMWDLTEAQFVVGCTAVVAVIVVVSTFASGGYGGSEESTLGRLTPASSAQVIDVCHTQAASLLKAPWTSDFGGDAVSGSEPNFWDRGYVDSRDSFGAKMRTNYTCTAIHDSGDDWRDVEVALQ
jgi:hypothetical protein